MNIAHKRVEQRQICDSLRKNLPSLKNFQISFYFLFNVGRLIMNSEQSAICFKFILFTCQPPPNDGGCFGSCAGFHGSPAQFLQ